MNNKKLNKGKIAFAISAMMTVSTFTPTAFASEAVNTNNTKLIYAGQLLAVPGESVTKNQTIVIENDVIKSIHKGFVTPKGLPENTEIIDLKNSFVMPGLIDMHVHMQQELGPHADKEKLTYSNTDYAMQSVEFARRTLHAGFTTVRDLGSKPEQIYALRKAIEKDWVEGPRVVAAGVVAITGGHMDVNGLSPDLMDVSVSQTVCDGADDCRRATRHAIKYGADLIKVASTGGVLSHTNTGTGQQMSDPELEEVVSAAHAMGRKVTSHAHAAAGINAALRAGVDSVEHGSYADEESIKLFKETGSYLVPTLLAGDTVVTLAKTSSFMPPAVKAKALRVGADMMKNFERSYKAGVNIAFGTDSGVSRHGNNAKEAVLMASAGMKTEDILKSATVNAAKLLSMETQLGTLAQGKYADIVAFDKSPFDDINTLLDARFVMKAGNVYKSL